MLEDRGIMTVLRPLTCTTVKPASDQPVSGVVVGFCSRANPSAAAGQDTTTLLPELAILRVRGVGDVTRRKYSKSAEIGNVTVFCALLRTTGFRTSAQPSGWLVEKFRSRKSPVAVA